MRNIGIGTVALSIWLVGARDHLGDQCLERIIQGRSDGGPRVDSARFRYVLFPYNRRGINDVDVLQRAERSRRGG